MPCLGDRHSLVLLSHWRMSERTARDAYATKGQTCFFSTQEHEKSGVSLHHRVMHDREVQLLNSVHPADHFPTTPSNAA
jgi:hypothetical protein